MAGWKRFAYYRRFMQFSAWRIPQMHGKAPAVAIFDGCARLRGGEKPLRRPSARAPPVQSITSGFRRNAYSKISRTAVENGHGGPNPAFRGSERRRGRSRARAAARGSPRVGGGGRRHRTRRIATARPPTMSCRPSSSSIHMMGISSIQRQHLRLDDFPTDLRLMSWGCFRCRTRFCPSGK